MNSFLELRQLGKGKLLLDLSRTPRALGRVEGSAPSGKRKGRLPTRRVSRARHVFHFLAIIDLKIKC